MNRFVAAVFIVAGVALPVCWLWHEKAVSETIQGDKSRDRSVAEKLNTIIIPDYPTSDVTLEEAVEILRFKSREHGTPAHGSSGQGVNIVIIAGGERRLPAVSGLSLRGVPLGEALRHVTSLVNLKCTVEQHAVAVRAPEDKRMPADQKGSALQQQLERRIRPTVNFQDATLEEAVEYLRISQGCLDVGDAPLAYMPQNIVLHLRDGIKRPPVSLDLRDIPISEALRYCAEISNTKLRYDTAAVMITDIETDLFAPDTPAASPTLPAVEFQDATLAEALDFVRIKSREINPDHRETSITMQPGGTSPSITLSLKNISIHETLRYIAELSSHSLSLEGQAYELRPL